MNNLRALRFLHVQTITKPEYVLILERFAA